jgi:H+/Cl- antiporter ClcA
MGSPREDCERGEEAGMSSASSVRENDTRRLSTDSGHLNHHESQLSAFSDGFLSQVGTVVDFENAYDMLKHNSLIVQMENREIMQEKVEAEEEKDNQKTGNLLVDSIITGKKSLPGGQHYAAIKKPYTFWVDSGLIILMGAFIGIVNLGYKYAILKAPMKYLTAGNPNYPNSGVGFAQGELWWIGLGAGTGLVNGLAKVLLRLESHMGFMGAIQMQESNPLEGVKVVICTIISLVGGSSIGPEAGLAAIGGGIASFFNDYVLKFSVDRAIRHKYFVLAGMASGFTGFLPSPILAVIMTWELGISPALWGLNQVHFLTLLIMGAVPAAAAFFAIEDTTIYDPLLLAIPDAADYNPSKYAFAVGIVFGVMGAGLAIAYYFISVSVRLAFVYPKMFAQKWFGKRIGSIVINVIGGILYGVLGYLFPLTMGDGSFQLQGIISSSKEIGSDVLAVSCFANMLTFWISMESGFVGGIFTPLLATGNLLGAVFSNITDVDPVVATSCSFIALAAAVIPAPLFLVFFSAALFGLGAKGIIPITTCCFTSHLLIDGIGAIPVISDWAVARIIVSKKKR